MTPMFVETLNSQAQEGVASQAASMRGKVRATQASLEFSQTQTTGTGNSRRGGRGRLERLGRPNPPHKVCVHRPPDSVQLADGQKHGHVS